MVLQKFINTFFWLKQYIIHMYDNDDIALSNNYKKIEGCITGQKMVTLIFVNYKVVVKFNWELKS